MITAEYWDEARKKLPKTPEYFHDLMKLDSSYYGEGPIPMPQPGCCSFCDGSSNVSPGIWWEPRSCHKGHDKGWTIMVDDNSENGNCWAQYINIDVCPNCDTKLEPYKMEIV